MKIHFVCMVNETTAEIVRGYRQEGLAQKAIAGHPNKYGVHWGYVTLDMVTTDELKEAKNLLEALDTHPEDDGTLGELTAPDAGGAS